MKKIIIIMASLFLMSCITTFKPYYKDLKPKYDSVYKVNNPLIIAVQDQRPYVLSGSKSEYFFGLARSLFGIPNSIYGAVTATNDILAYIHLLINNETGVYRIQKKKIGVNVDGVKSALEIRGNKALLFIQAREWKTDMPTVGTGLMWYDLRAVVFDNQGNVLAKKNVKSRDEIVNPDPNSDSTEKTGRWYQKAKADALGKILLDSKIISAINIATSNISSSILNTNNANANAKSKCSTEQILGMKNSNMSDKQITAACK